MPDETGPSTQAPSKKPRKDLKILMYAGTAVALLLLFAALSGLTMMRQHEREETAFRLQVARFSDRCLGIPTDEAGMTHYACRLLVRARPSGNTVIEITEIKRGGGTVVVMGRWNSFEAPTRLRRLAFFADPDAYNEPGALAAPGEEAYPVLADIWLAQAAQAE